MKFTVTMTDTYALQNAIHDAVSSTTDFAWSAEEKKMTHEEHEEITRKLCSRWFEWGFCLTVEIDTEAMTCVVVPAKIG
jgi:hypothetical protein